MIKATNKIGKGLAETGAELYSEGLIPQLMLETVQDKICEKFGSNNTFKIAGAVLSTIAMSEIAMLLGLISNPLTFDPAKLAQMKQMELLKSIDKKIDSMKNEPLRTAVEKLQDVFHSLQNRNWEAARKDLKKVKEEAQRAKNLDYTFDKKSLAIKMWTFAEVMLAQYENHSENGPHFRPIIQLSTDDKKMILTKLQVNIDELTSSAKKTKTWWGGRTQDIKNTYQNIIDDILKAQYNVISICKGFTNPTSIIQDDQPIQFKLSTKFLPMDENDSAFLPLGVTTGQNKKINGEVLAFVWRGQDEEGQKNAYIRIGRKKFILPLTHATPEGDLSVQLLPSDKGVSKSYKCRFGEDHNQEAFAENGTLPPKLKSVSQLREEERSAESK